MFRILTAALALSITGANAQIPEPLAGQVLSDVNVTTILPAFQTMNLTTERVTLGGGDALVIRQGSINIILRPRVCSPDCAGLLMYALFEGTAPGGVLNAYNEATPPTSAFVTGGNTVLSRYLIADHGITAGSLLVNIGVFESTVQKWMQGAERSAAQSVSLGEAPQVSTDPETEAFLGELMGRREFYSTDVAHDTY